MKTKTIFPGPTAEFEYFIDMDETSILSNLDFKGFALWKGQHIFFPTCHAVCCLFRREEESPPASLNLKWEKTFCDTPEQKKNKPPGSLGFR